MKIDTKWLVETRRAFHKIPETAFNEHKTSELIKKYLAELDIGPVKSLGGTGVSIDIGTGKGPVLGIRADMDALPILEKESSRNSEYISQHEGVMHACGHDVHTTTVLGAIRSLATDKELLKSLKGTVRFFFQPAEEIGQGASRMIEDGVLEGPNIDRLMALHVSPSIKAGSLGLCRGSAFAACDHFKIVIRGIDGHGSQPHATRDPIAAGAYLINQLQSVVSRSLNPLKAGVISVCQFHAGTAFNIIPEKAVLHGTARSLDEDTRNLIEKRMRQLVATLPATFDLPEASIEYFRDTPTGFNDLEFADEVYQLAESIVGEDCIEFIPPSMGAEDFAFYSRSVDGKLRPSAPRTCFIRLGVRNNEKGICWDGQDIIGIHNAMFDIDEDALGIGVQLFLDAIKKYVT